jgi:hypothetical protein
MLGPIFDSPEFKALAEKSALIRWLYAARHLRWEFAPYKYRIYLDYPVNPTPRYGYGKPLHGLIYELLDKNRSKYEETINTFVPYGEQLRSISIAKPADPTEPFWKNGWVEDLDPVSLYCFPSLLNSKLYLEIGSGNSTKFVRKSIQQNNLKTRIVSIDPHPRAEIDALCDELIRRPLEETDPLLFDELGAGDILMIDNSHRCFQNSDVTVVFLEILPRLKPGVLIYIDDVYWPCDYPPGWKYRYYSEQYLLAVLLLADTSRYEVILPCQFVANNAHLAGVIDTFWDQIRLKDVRGFGNGFWMVVKPHQAVAVV